MNRHEVAHAIVFEALGSALTQAYGYVPTGERHQLAELVCDEVEHETHRQLLEQPAAGGTQ